MKVLETTPPYFDYNWTASSSMEEIFGEGFTEKLQAALVGLDVESHKEILDLFSTERFITTKNSNYQAIEDVARELEIIK